MTQAFKRSQVDWKSDQRLSAGKSCKGFLRALGPDAAAAQASEDEQSADEYLNKIALDTYKRTGSWLKAYQAVFVLYAPISQSDLSRHYSSLLS